MSLCIKDCAQNYMYALKSRRLQCQQRQEEPTNDMQSNEIISEDNVNTSNTLFIEKVSY